MTKTQPKAGRDADHFMSPSAVRSFFFVATLHICSDRRWTPGGNHDWRHLVWAGR